MVPFSDASYLHCQGVRKLQVLLTPFFPCMVRFSSLLITAAVVIIYWVFCECEYECPFLCHITWLSQQTYMLLLGPFGRWRNGCLKHTFQLKMAEWELKPGILSLMLHFGSMHTGAHNLDGKTYHSFALKWCYRILSFSCLSLESWNVKEENLINEHGHWKSWFLSWRPLEAGVNSLSIFVSHSVMYMADGLFIYWIRKNKLNCLQANIIQNHCISVCPGTWRLSTIWHIETEDAWTR